MTLTSEFADRLRANTDLEVHGAFSGALARKEVRRDSAWVLLLQDDSRPSEVVGCVRQVADVIVGVLLRVRNRRDDRGEAGLGEIEAAREQVFAALLGWTPASAFGEVTHREGRAQPPQQDAEQWWLDTWRLQLLRAQE